MIPGPALARVLARVCAPVCVPVCSVLLLLGAAPAPAADVVAAPGRLSDSDFYRLVSCAAPPGGACARPMLRWRSESPIRVALRRIDPGYLGRPKQRAEAALTRALRELNATGARFHLARVGPADRAEITVFFLDLDPGVSISGTGIDWVDGAQIDEIATLIAVDPDRTRILGASIVVAAGLETKAFEAAMLKALTRAMGLTTEVAGTAYQGISPLAHDSYAATRLGPQDLTALRQHYERN